MPRKVVLYARQWRGLTERVIHAQLTILDLSMSDAFWESGYRSNQARVEDTLNSAYAMSRECPNDVRIGITLDGVTIAEWDREIVNVAVLDGVIMHLTIPQ